jgi:hypothetical protein
MDALMCIDDLACKKGLQLFADEAGANHTGEALSALIPHWSTN